MKKTGLNIGALTTINSIKTSNTIREEFPVLTQSAQVVGTAQVRNRATLDDVRGTAVVWKRKDVLLMNLGRNLAPLWWDPYKLSSCASRALRSGSLPAGGATRSPPAGPGDC